MLEAPLSRINTDEFCKQTHINRLRAALNPFQDGKPKMLFTTFVYYYRNAYNVLQYHFKDASNTIK